MNEKPSDAGDRDRAWGLSRLVTLLWGFHGSAITTSTEMPAVNETLVATAPAPPRLVTEILNGEPVSVLYVTRADDQVLVRCYPGYVPVVRNRAMGSNSQDDAAPQEGVLSCGLPANLRPAESAPASP